MKTAWSGGRSRQVRCAAALLLALLGFAAWAEQRRESTTYFNAKALFDATQLLSVDLGRPPSAAEWPAVLLAAPPTGEVWRGPYVADVRRDAWNNDYRFRADLTGPGTFGIYSVGVNGIDESGAGDDVSSWQEYDTSFYPRYYHWSDYLLLSLPVVFAVLLLMLCVSALLAWHRARSTGGSQ